MLTSIFRHLIVSVCAAGEELCDGYQISDYLTSAFGARKKHVEVVVPDTY